MMRHHVVVLLVSILLSFANAEDFVPLTREFIAMLKNESTYNRYATPTQFIGVATNVSMSMYIEGMSSFSAQTMDYHLDMYFQQAWKDPRLAHNYSGKMLVRDKAVFELMWHPDLYFANARHATFQEITDDNFLVWVDSDGRVFYDCRISLVVICIMDLWKYPLDSQVCEMRILSYAYPESQLRLKWSDRIRPIDRNMDIRMPDMQLIDIRTGTCNGTYATGIWSCMTAIFIVEREMMHHVMQTYLPSALIVVISWFNFWLDVDSAPARVSLSITTLLTISTQANAVKLALPEVSYMKAIDVWMGSCMAFVFGVMIEFTICHFAKNRELSRSDLRPTIVDSVVNTLFVGNQDIVDVRLRPEDELEGTIDNGGYGARLGVPSTSSETQHFLVGDNNERGSTHKRHRKVTRRALAWTRSLRNLRGRRVANKIDEKCRFIFPISFVVFNILYWSFYILLN